MKKLFMMSTVFFVLVICSVAVVINYKGLVSYLNVITTQAPLVATSSQVSMIPYDSKNGLYYSNEYRYSFKIPEGWEVQESKSNNEVYVVNSHLKALEDVRCQQDKTYLCGSDFLSTVISIKPVHSDSKYDLPPVNKPIVATNTTVETLGATNGLLIGYRFYNHGSKPYVASFDLLTNDNLNRIGVVFPLSSDFVVTSDIARDFLKSFSLTTTTNALNILNATTSTYWNEKYSLEITYPKVLNSKSLSDEGGCSPVTKYEGILCLGTPASSSFDEEMSLTMLSIYAKKVDSMETWYKDISINEYYRKSGSNLRFEDIEINGIKARKILDAKGGYDRGEGECYVTGIFYKGTIFEMCDYDSSQAVESIIATLRFK